MLDPEYLLHISEGAEEIAETLHEDIVARIIERMMYRIGRGDRYLLTAQDRWQIQVLDDAGYLLEEIRKEIAAKTKLQEDEIKSAMEDAGVTAAEYDDLVYQSAGISVTPLPQSPHLIRLMQRNYEATVGEWRNYTRTMAQTAQKAFVSAVDMAYILTASGALSYTGAVMEAVNEIAKDGVTITYPSGRTDTIETAALRAVRTGISQATAEVQLARMKEYEWDIVLVSAHTGARPSHHVWQGKFYSLSGKNPDFPDFKSMTGYGTPGGLCGINCRHSFGPGDGEHNPYQEYDRKENMERYQKEQRQRMLERRIRKTKREVLAWRTASDEAVDDKVKFENYLRYQKKAALLQKQNEEYAGYCRDNGLKPLHDRIRIAKWDREQAVKAREAARNAGKSEHD